MKRVGRLNRLQRMGLLAFLAGLVVLFSLLSPHFLRWENLSNVLLQSAVQIVVAVGMTLVVATRGIDLSVGSVMALSGIVTAGLMKAQWAWGLALLAGLASGAAMGALNGLGVALLGINPFIVTLGTAGIFRAVALIATDARPIYGFPLGFRALGSGHWGPLPSSVLIALAAFGFGALVVAWTRFGTNARAVGDNLEAAYRLGVPVTRTRIGIYTLCSTFAALGGIIVTARLNTAEAIAGMGIELEAIAAVVMGGTSFAGGEASVLGTLLGALIIGTLANGLTIINVPTYYQQLVIGVVFMAAVLADRLRRRTQRNALFET